MGDAVKTRLCITLTALAVAVVAGGWLMGDTKTPDDPPKVKGQLPAHFKKLGLSDKQIQQIYKIEATYHDKIQPLQQQIDDLKKAEHQDVDDVLTDEQKAHLKELLTAEVSDKDKPAPPPDKPAPPPADKPAPPPDKPTTDKDKPAPDKPVIIDKDKTLPVDKDKPAPPKDK